jgi:hypothetical protein
MDKSRIYTIAFSLFVILFTISAGFTIVALDQTNSIGSKVCDDWKETVVMADDAITHTRSWNERTISRQYDMLLSPDGAYASAPSIQTEVKLIQYLSNEMVAHIILLQVDLAEFVDGPNCKAVAGKRENVAYQIYYPVRLGGVDSIRGFYPYMTETYSESASPATLLKEAIEKYKRDILSICEGMDPRLLGLECNNVNGEPWEEVTFGNKSIAATFIILNTLISDVRAAEAEALRFFIANKIDEE